jgi:hypothetical protein
MEGGVLKVHHYAESNNEIDRGAAIVADGSSDNLLMFKYPRKPPGEHVYELKATASGGHVQTPFASGDYVCKQSN